MTGITVQFNPTGFGSATIVSAVTDFMKDHIDYMKERVLLERNRDEALLENQKKKETHFNVFCLLCTSFVSIQFVCHVLQSSQIQRFGHVSVIASA